MASAFKAPAANCQSQDQIAAKTSSSTKDIPESEAGSLAFATPSHLEHVGVDIEVEIDDVAVLFMPNSKPAWRRMVPPMSPSLVADMDFQKGPKQKSEESMERQEGQEEEWSFQCPYGPCDKGIQCERSSRRIAPVFGETTMGGVYPECESRQNDGDSSGDHAAASSTCAAASSTGRDSLPFRRRAEPDEELARSSESRDGAIGTADGQADGFGESTKDCRASESPVSWPHPQAQAPSSPSGCSFGKNREVGSAVEEVGCKLASKDPTSFCPIPTVPQVHGCCLQGKSQRASGSETGNAGGIRIPSWQRCKSADFCGGYYRRRVGNISAGHGSLHPRSGCRHGCPVDLRRRGRDGSSDHEGGCQSCPEEEFQGGHFSVQSCERPSQDENRKVSTASCFHCSTEHLPFMPAVGVCSACVQSYTEGCRCSARILSEVESTADEVSPDTDDCLWDTSHEFCWVQYERSLNEIHSLLGCQYEWCTSSSCMPAGSTDSGKKNVSFDSSVQVHLFHQGDAAEYTLNLPDVHHVLRQCWGLYGFGSSMRFSCSILAQAMSDSSEVQHDCAQGGSHHALSSTECDARSFPAVPVSCQLSSFWGVLAGMEQALQLEFRAFITGIQFLW